MIWVWVKIKPPQKPQASLLGSIYQWGGYQFLTHSHSATLAKAHDELPASTKKLFEGLHERLGLGF